MSSAEAAARRLYTLGPDAVTLALLAAARRIAEQDARIAELHAATGNAAVTPATPSGMIPVYTKPNATTPRGRRRKRPGARDGHPGHRRPTPTRIDRRQEHRLKVCPCCGGPLQRCKRSRTRLIEDLPENLQSVVTEHTLHRDYWRVQGRTCWLWCFANGQVCYYLIDRCRGSPVLQRFFGDAFDGILLHDFWTAYESIDVLDRQYCLVHLLRELEKVDQHNTTAQWQAFAKTLRRLIRDGIRLRKRPDFSPEKYQSRILRLGRRLDTFIATESNAPDARRLLKRLRRTGDHLFTFLDYPQIPFENNCAERMIRPAVILRKNSQSNRSDRGAVTQAVLMSIYRTLRLRGHDPLQTIAHALRTRLQTGHLPPLPPAIVADG